MTKPKTSTIPNFKTTQEEAEYWDTHSFSDHWSELKPVKLHFAKKFSTPITIRFDQSTLQTLRTEAGKKGIGATTLIRMWVYEHLERIKQAHA